MEEQIRLLIIEDEERVALLIQKGLTEMGYVVDTVHSAESAIDIFQKRQYQLLISDIMLPEMSGIDLCNTIRKFNKDIPIIMLTALGSTDDKLEGFDAGADDYMTKPFDLRELNVRIKALLKRTNETPSNQNIYYADLVLDLSRRTAVRNKKSITLSPKEYNLLHYMISNADRLLTRSEIAEKVWNTHFDTGTNFIDVYINYLRKKIDRDFETKLIHTKPGMGFIFTDKP